MDDSERGKPAENERVPDPNIKVVSLVAGLSLQEAHLLADQIEAAGVRVEISSGRSAMGEWTGTPTAPIVAGGGPGLAGNVFGQGTCELLVSAKDLDTAKAVVARYVEG